MVLLNILDDSISGAGVCGGSGGGNLFKQRLKFKRGYYYCHVYL